MVVPTLINGTTIDGIARFTWVLLAAVLLPAAQRQASADPYVGLSARVVNVPTGHSLLKGIPDDRFHVVNRDSLNALPIILELGFSVYDKTGKVSMGSTPSRWIEHVRLVVERDGTPDSTLFLKPLRQLAVKRDDLLHPKWASARPIGDVAALASDDTVRSFCELRTANGTSIATGVYGIKVKFDSETETLFKLPIRANSEIGLNVLGSDEEPASNQIEDLIERHYLWACSLYPFDRNASKNHFEIAWKRRHQYLRNGAGDEPNAWNITPRWQASLISDWLDRPQDEISYLSLLLSKQASMRVNGKECKMRYYHFGRERGFLPRDVEDQLAVKLDRLSMQVLGKTASGRALAVPTTPRPKRFPEARDQGGE